MLTLEEVVADLSPPVRYRGEKSIKTLQATGTHLLTPAFNRADGTGFGEGTVENPRQYLPQAIGLSQGRGMAKQRQQPVSDRYLNSPE